MKKLTIFDKNHAFPHDWEGIMQSLTFYQQGMPMIQRLMLNLQVRFESRSIDGSAHLTFDAGERSVTLDTSALLIDHVKTDDGSSIPFTIEHEEASTAHRPLQFVVPSDRIVRVAYACSPCTPLLVWNPRRSTRPFVLGMSCAITPCHHVSALPFTGEVLLTMPDWARAYVLGGYMVEQHGWSDPWRTERWRLIRPSSADMFMIAVGELEDLCNMFPDIQL